MTAKVDKLVVESSLKKFETRLSEVQKEYKEEDYPLLKDLQEEYDKLKEEFSAGDWTRMGVITGMLWYKLDTLVSHIKDATSTLKNIERNTSKIS